MPLVLVTVLIGGTVTGVRLVGQQQLTQVAARNQLREFSANYIGQGKAMVGFKSPQEAGEVVYRTDSERKWKTARMERVNDYYIVWLDGLTEGENYTLRILGGEYRFTAK